MLLTKATTTTVYLRLLLFLAALQITTQAHAQGYEVGIVVDATSRTAEVSGKFRDGFRPRNPLNLAYMREAAGFPSLAGRIGKIELADANGTRVGLRKLMDGEYVASAEYRSWKYSINLAPPTDRAGFAHASWINDSGGILMLADILPEFGQPPGLMKLKLPDGWQAHAASIASLTNQDPWRSVVFIGMGHRVIDVKAETGDLRLLVKGEWYFTDEEARQMAQEIFDEYSKILGGLPKTRYLIGLQRFPSLEPNGQWEAETRGRTVTIMSSDMPFRTQSLQRLHEQLRHEIFHLWFPNGVELTGDYAWFYEGFAMYMSLKLAVKLNRIRFGDFLDTLGRAHTIDTNSRPRRPLTDRGIDPTVRYARGMIVAFLSDVELLRNSRGKNDVGHSLRRLFVDHSGLVRNVPASDAVFRTMFPSPLFQRYVDGVEVVDWTADLAAAGIESKQTGRTTTLAVMAKPGSRQKAILDRLGYNNWRKARNRK